MQPFTPRASGFYLEGLAVDTDNQRVWYSDVIGGGIHTLNNEGATRTYLDDRRWTGGITLNHCGSALSSGQGGIMWTNPASGKSGWLIQTVDGEPLNGVNEMAPDNDGGLYFGTIDLDSIVQGKAPQPSAIYYLGRNGCASLVAEDIGFCNGISLSPDNRQLYCNNTFNCTYVYDVLDDRSLSNRQVLLAKTDCDGMAVDNAGNLWVTGCRSAAIDRLTPQGTSLPPFETPASGTTQIRFGGADMRDVYIATVTEDSVKRIKAGLTLTEPQSVLYQGRSEQPGYAIPRAQFQLS